MTTLETLDSVVSFPSATGDHHAILRIRVDMAEHTRRAGHGLGALTRSQVNDMFVLPHGYWVSWADLTPGRRWAMRDYSQYPDGIVERSEDGARRQAVPPVTVDLAVVTGLSWTPGMRAAGAFAPFCSRVAQFGQRQRIPCGRLWEAGYWGIGVWRETPAGVEELVAPAPWRQRYWTEAAWSFRERVYDAWLTDTGQQPRPPGQLPLTWETGR